MHLSVITPMVFPTIHHWVAQLVILRLIIRQLVKLRYVHNYLPLRSRSSMPFSWLMMLMIVSWPGQLPQLRPLDVAVTHNSWCPVTRPSRWILSSQGSSDWAICAVQALALPPWRGFAAIHAVSDRFWRQTSNLVPTSQ